MLLHLQRIETIYLCEISKLVIISNAKPDTNCFFKLVFIWLISEIKSRIHRTKDTLLQDPVRVTNELTGPVG